MSGFFFPKFKANVGAKAISLTADTLKASLITFAAATGKVAIVTAATNASPIVLTTSGAHGYTAGDVILVGGIAGNLAANGLYVATAVTSTTITLGTLLDSVATTGSGAYTSGGYTLDVTTATILSDIGNANGTDITLTGAALSGGVLSATFPAWSGLTATKSYAVAIYDSTVSNDLVMLIDGMQQVYVCAQAAVSATSIVVQRLAAAIANGTTIVFSDGASATLTAQANVGDTALTVSALAAIVHRQATADVVTFNTVLGSTSGLPFTPGGGGGLQFTPDTGVNKIGLF